MLRGGGGTGGNEARPVGEERAGKQPVHVIIAASAFFFLFLLFFSNVFLFFLLNIQLQWGQGEGQ